MKKFPYHLALGAFGLACTANALAADFSTEVYPVLHTHCLKCHTVEKNTVKGGFAIDDLEKLQGSIGEGETIEPGNPGDSHLMRLITDDPDSQDLMPPPGKGRKLNDDEIMIIQNWIKEGAKLPDQLPTEAELAANAPAEASEGMETKPAAATAAVAPAAPVRKPGVPDLLIDPVKWHNTDGRTVEALYGGRDGENVILFIDAREVHYPYRNLKSESQKQADQAEKELRASVTLGHP